MEKPDGLVHRLLNPRRVLPRVFIRLIVKLPDLLFGVATSDHQAEAYEPEYADFRDHWEKHQNQTPRGRATDFWNRYPEDIGLARDLGCKIFRFSISWSRVEPRRGEFAADVLNHYRKVAEEVLAAEHAPAGYAASLYLAGSCARSRRNDFGEISSMVPCLCPKGSCCHW